MFEDKLRLFSAIKRLAFIGVSKWVADEAKKSPIAQKATITTSIYNWIDFNQFHTEDISALRKEKELDGRFVILGVSAVWEERKGLDRFLELSKHLNPDERILLIGDMPEGVILPENIISIKKTDSVAELVKYYNLADVFLTFSLEETFGKVSAEALSCGTPVICYNSTANPELVGERCGKVVEKNDFDGIVNAIKEIKANGKAYYSEHCIAYSHENFDKDKNIEKYIELYQKLIDG
jgi:glycosyltransferase involved in cell wall biosynthesis